MDAINTYKWLINVISSCDNLSQIDASINLINNYKKLYNDPKLINNLQVHHYLKFKHLSIN